jgi:hypothetical protein
MNKYFLVTQPPISDYYTFLVDDINETATFGHTTDVDKCEYNKQVIERMGLDINFKIQVETAFSEKGITTVIPLGRYISIIKASKDETRQEMFFIDSLSNANFREQNEKIDGYFSNNIVNEFERVHSLLKSDFLETDDIVEISMVDDDLKL